MPFDILEMEGAHASCSRKKKKKNKSEIDILYKYHNYYITLNKTLYITPTKVPHAASTTRTDFHKTQLHLANLSDNNLRVGVTPLPQ
jgi:hypothetical protein